jgi:HAE1 family hydrophobic/amphiphilic exporter-1
MVPTFYDSIEIARDRMFAKFGRRAKRWNVAVAGVLTFIEAILTLIFVRLVFRLIMKVVHRITGRGNKPQPPLAEAA